MQLSFLGACREVGRAAFLAENAGTRVLLDYGMKPNGEVKSPLPVSGKVDGLIISHAHLDHSGFAPALYEKHAAPCFMTPPSLPLIDLLVKDSLKVQRLRGLEPVFSQVQLKSMLGCVIPTELERRRHVGSMAFEFHDAGHILGSASVRLDSEKVSLVYTGDIKFENTCLHNAAFRNYKGCDVLVTEATYGGRNHPPREELEKNFVAACTEVCDDYGNVLVPSFAVGRAQELACVLNKYNFDYPVYIDGMAKQAAEIMLEFPHYLRDYKEFHSAMNEAVWVKTPKMRLRALEGPSAILSSAGMLQGGPAVSYLVQLQKKKNGAVFFVGYQPETTPGHVLLNKHIFTYEDERMDFRKTRIEYFDFSAHAGSDELLDFARKLGPRAVFIVHSDPPEADALAQRIREEVGSIVFIPSVGEKHDLTKFV